MTRGRVGEGRAHHGSGIRPTSAAALAEQVAGLVQDLGGRDGPRPVRVIVDGPPPAAPEALAAAVVDLLRARGRPAVLALAADFLRPASLRLEFGREDPDMFLDGWLDAGALRRELLDPLVRTGRVLPRLWDAGRDRSYRAEPVALGDAGVVVLAGPLLLGRGLPAELTVHLRMTAAALDRRMPPGERWTLPAYERYERERNPGDLADVVVLADHPERPAVWVRAERQSPVRRKSGRGGS